MRKYGIVILIALCGMFASYAVAQVNNAGMKLLERIDSRFAMLDSLIFKTVPSERIVPGVFGLKAAAAPVRKSDSLFAKAVNDRVEAEIGQIRRQTGVQVTGQTYYRFDDMLGMDEDDAVSRYRAKVQVEGRWYFLQSGLFKRRGRMNEARIKGEIDLLARTKDHTDISIARQKEFFRQQNDRLLASVLLHRIYNLDLLREADLYLLENENVSSDNLLRILNEKAEAERMLSTLRGDFEPATDLSTLSAYVIEIDTAALIKHIESTETDLKLLSLRCDLLEQQARNTSIWSDIRIAPFVRYSWYERTTLPNSSNVDAGLSFTIPINNIAARRRDAIRAQKHITELEREDILIVASDRIHFIAGEIERYNKASLGEWQRMRELKDYIKLRTNAYENRIGQYNRLSRLKEYNNYLLCMEKLLEFQYRRDCLVADLQGLLRDSSIMQYCTETVIDRYGAIGNKANPEK